MAKKFADIHCHPSMKPYSKGIQGKTKALNSANAKEKSSIWHTHSNFGEGWRELVERLLKIAKYKQSDMTSLEDGDVELVVISITPPELGFMQLNRRKIPPLAKPIFRTSEGLINFVTEFGKARAYEIQQGDFSYFRDLEREYDYISQLDGIRTLEGKKYILAKRGQNITHLMQQNKECVVAVLSIEGAHALLPFAGVVSFNDCTPYVDDLAHPNTQKLLQTLKDNIRSVKQWENGAHCPLFITLNHHFWNLMAGHSPSLADMLTEILDQTREINRGMTEVGREVVKALLSTQNGPRILIDTRHMSVQARRWYFNFIQQHNTHHPQDRIPIISSHSAANGYRTMSESELHEVYFHHNVPRIIANEKYKASKVFNNWSINISDEEALILFNSGGIIGISLDQRVLAGRFQLAKTRKTHTPTAWAEPFFNQVNHFYHLLHSHSNGNTQAVLDTLCIGSDFDGIMNPINHFGSARKFNSLKQELHGYIATAQQDQLFPGATAQEITDAVFFDSARKFIEKWYV